MVAQPSTGCTAPSTETIMHLSLLLHIAGISVQSPPAVPSFVAGIGRGPVTHITLAHPGGPQCSLQTFHLMGNGWLSHSASCQSCSTSAQRPYRQRGLDAVTSVVTALPSTCSSFVICCLHTCSHVLLCLTHRILNPVLLLPLVLLQIYPQQMLGTHQD